MGTSDGLRRQISAFQAAWGCVELSFFLAWYEDFTEPIPTHHRDAGVAVAWQAHRIVTFQGKALKVRTQRALEQS